MTTSKPERLPFQFPPWVTHERVAIAMTVVAAAACESLRRGRPRCHAPSRVPSLPGLLRRRDGLPRPDVDAPPIVALTVARSRVGRPWSTCLLMLIGVAWVGIGWYALVGASI